MKKLVRTIIFCAAALCSSFVEGRIDVSAELGGGYRQDSLNWLMKARDGGLQIASELEWEDIRIAQTMATVKFLSDDRWYGRLSGSYGKVFEGKNYDTDYIGEERFRIFRAESQAGKGETFDLSGGVGYLFCLSDPRWTVAPLAGYSHSEQHFRLYNGALTINRLFPFDTGPIIGLHSNYRTKWRGPWVGTDVAFQATSCLSLKGTVEGHYACYRATGHWNLRDDFAEDFVHAGHGWGGVVSLGADYALSGPWKIGAAIGYQYWRMNNGTERLRLREPDLFLNQEEESYYSSPRDIHVRIKRAVWRSFAATATIGCQF